MTDNQPLSSESITRRQFHQTSMVALAGLGAGVGVGTELTGSAAAADAPAIVAASSLRPRIDNGVASGDVTAGSAVLWSRTNRPARMVVDLSTTNSFRKVRTYPGGDALESRDFTSKLQLTGLTAGTEYFYRIRFQDLEDLSLFSEAATGRFRTAPSEPTDIRFVWSADTAGQGYGIDRDRGGMTTYRAMREMKPDFLVHCGDLIYADNPIPESIKLDDGTLWTNLTTPETSKVAETLAEFRAKFRYNTLDEHFREFHAQVPIFAQWDDHETVNNWYPGEQLLSDDRYTVKSVDLLSARARTALFEYVPIRESLRTPGRIYRTLPYGPQLELFFIDMRSHRGPNAANRAGGEGDPSLLGKSQLGWLKRSLKASSATWKVICSDMPIGLIVGDGPGAFEAVANGDGPPAGREKEVAELLRFLRDEKIRNVVWICGDVHHAASIHYSPDRAQFQEFEPFWEFVSGPIHAGTFGPNALDNTFGPKLEFLGIPKDLRPNRPPSEGMQFFGVVEIEAKTGNLTVAHYNVAKEKLWSRTLEPVI